VAETEDVDVRLRLQGARDFSRQVKTADRDLSRLERRANTTGLAGRRMGAGSRIGAAGASTLGRSSKVASGSVHLLAGAAGRGTRLVAGLGRAAGRAAMFLGVGAAVGLGYAVKKGLDEIKAHQVASAQTAAVLDSTGRKANVTAKQVRRLSNEIEAMSGMDDVAVQAGQNLLLTFTNIRNEAGKGNDIFTQSTRVMADMAQALGQDPRKSAILLGKALNDPVKGVTALQRVGVSFTQAQRDQIKALVENGKTMAAQKLILRELNTEFGGSAKAYGKTLPGQIDRLKARFEELAGRIAQRLVPVLTQAVDWVNRHWPQIERVVVRVGRAVWDSIEAVVDAVRENWDTIKDVFFTGVRVARQVVRFIGRAWAWLSDLATEHWGTIRKAAQDVLAWYNEKLKPGIQNVLRILSDFWDRWGGKITAFFERTVGNIIRQIQNVANLVAAIMRGDWSEAWAAAQRIVGTVWDQIKNTLSNLGPILLSLAKTAAGKILTGIYRGLQRSDKWMLEQLKDLPNTVRDIGVWAAGKLKDGGLAILSGIASGLSNLPGWAVDKFQALFDWIRDDMPGLISSAATGIWDGLLSGFASIVNKIADMWNSTIGGRGAELGGVGFEIPKLGKVTWGRDMGDRGGTLPERTGPRAPIDIAPRAPKGALREPLEAASRVFVHAEVPVMIDRRQVGKAVRDFEAERGARA
jgi:hypothetical protein